MPISAWLTASMAASRPRAHPAARSVALNDQNKLAGSVPKDTPFQRLRRPDELNLTTEITASLFCAVNSVVAALTPSVAPPRRSRSGAELEKWLPVVFQRSPYRGFTTMPPEPFLNLARSLQFISLVAPDTNCAISRDGIGSVRVARTGS